MPGGVTLPPTQGEDAGAIQTIGARFSRGVLTLQQAAELGCRACASPGGGCQFLGTAATSQVVAEALGMALPHSALAPSGQPVWRDLAVRSAEALTELEAQRGTMSTLLSAASIRNAMTVHAAFGGSTNLLLHIPAIAHAAGLPRPTVQDWIAINRRVPRLVDVLPNGPVGHPTVRVFLAGGVPEVMLHLRDLGLLDLDALTVTGQSLGENLAAWEQCERRARFRELLREMDAVEPDDVIMAPPQAARARAHRHARFPARQSRAGGLGDQGDVDRSDASSARTASVRLEGPARVFTSEAAAIAALRAGRIQAGDVMVLAGIGPMGTGMEETYQITSALKTLPFGKHVALADRCAFFRRLDRRVHRPHRARGARRRTDRQAARWRRDSHRDRPAGDARERRFSRHRRGALLARRGRGAARRAAVARRPGAPCRAAGGDEALGGAATRERRDVGRVRV